MRISDWSSDVCSADLALSKGRCNPFSRNRDGTIVGEGAALFLMDRDEAEIALYGVGAASEAYSMTAPEPEGTGVEQAEIGRAACRARVWQYVSFSVGCGPLKQKTTIMVTVQYQ